MMNHCEDCGVRREDGWLIVEGRCVECGPAGFEARKALLKLQADELVGGGVYDFLD